MKIKDIIFKKNEEGKTEIRTFVVAAAVIFAVMFSFFSKSETNGEKTKKDEEILVEEEKTAEQSDYFQKTEDRLEKILSGIKGAGKVEVMIYYNNMGKKVVASDSKEKSEISERGSEGKGYESADTLEKSTVLYGKGSEEKPFVTEEKLPEASGVLVLAEGAGNEKIRFEIFEAVRALLGVPANRIMVSTKSGG